VDEIQLRRKLPIEPSFLFISHILNVFSLLPSEFVRASWLGVVAGVAVTSAHDGLGGLICSRRDPISPRRVLFVPVAAARTDSWFEYYILKIKPCASIAGW
jgi:hypothetical protein